MSFSPFARYRNFTLNNLKDLLELYPDMSSKMNWNEVTASINVVMPAYQRTAYQQACQLGLEDRSGATYKIQSYLLAFDDMYLEKYLEFWLKTYYAPNPYVNSTDTPMLIFCELCDAVLASPSLEVDYYSFFTSRIGGGSDDILMNALKEYGKPLQYKEDTAVAPVKKIFFVDAKDKGSLQSLVTRIKTDFPIEYPIDRKTFFNRFSYDRFCKFYKIPGKYSPKSLKPVFFSNYTVPSNLDSSLGKRNRIVFGAPGTGKSFRLNEDKKNLLGENNETDYERVTFHPDYSYANFVGTYKPVMKAHKQSSTDAEIIRILCNKNMTAQDKYDSLYESFKSGDLTVLAPLLGLYSDEDFSSKKADGTEATKNNTTYSANIGKKLRNYVELLNIDNIATDIGYEYVPGPFMRVYVNALKSAMRGEQKPHLLIIEEINRANVAAVFGDVFQLLDRGDDNVSEYPIQASEDIKKYLAKELGGNPEDYNKIRIPDNMFIWATMNSADQGVFPMDTAFKRRWDFIYIGIDENDKDIRGKYVVVGSKSQQKIEWNELRKSINEFLAEEKINEDKQLGPYFISRKITVPSGEDIDPEKFVPAFKNKVLMYLFDDAAKQKRQKLFEGMKKGQNRYSEVCKAFEEQGIGIFNGTIQGRMKNISDLKISDYEIDKNGLPIKETGE